MTTTLLRSISSKRVRQLFICIYVSSAAGKKKIKKKKTETEKKSTCANDAKTPRLYVWVCILVVGGVLFYNVTFRDCKFMCSPPRGRFEMHSARRSRHQSSPPAHCHLVQATFFFASLYHPYRPTTKDVLVGYYIIYTPVRVPAIHYNMYGTLHGT